MSTADVRAAQDRLAVALGCGTAPTAHERAEAAAMLVTDKYLADDLELGRRLRAVGYADAHIVTFSRSGYGLQHLIECRPDLIGCHLNEWLASELAPAREPGRYAMEWPHFPHGEPTYQALP